MTLQGLAIRSSSTPVISLL